MWDIQIDKLNHFFYGSALAFLVTLLTVILKLNLFLIPFLGVFISLGLELYQGQFKKGKFEWLDAVWTFIPFMLFFLSILTIGTINK